MSYERDPYDLRGQETDAAERVEKERLAREVEDADIRWLMGSKRGRRIVWRLLEVAQPFADPFNANTAIMSRNVGNQLYGRWLFARIRGLCPELDLVMLKENARNGGNDGNDGPKHN